MADVFISYARADKKLAQSLAAQFEAEGHSVWWDAAATPGANFREEISRQLEAAKMVVVIWTITSVKSQWVISEAQRAASQEKLIPVRTPDVEVHAIPQPFDTLHTPVLHDGVFSLPKSRHSRSIRWLVKVIVALALAAATCLYVVVNHSAITRELICDGHWKEKPSQASEIAYVQLEEYRWWVHLWGRSDGNVKVQTDKLGLSDYISAVQKIHDGQLAMYSFHDYDFRDDKFGRFRGGYRVANKEITILFLDDLIFIGTCRY